MPSLAEEWEKMRGDLVAQNYEPEPLDRDLYYAGAMAVLDLLDGTSAAEMPECRKALAAEVQSYADHLLKVLGNQN